MAQGSSQHPNIPPVVPGNDMLKIGHYLGGIFLWEYFSTIWFEWSFITGKRPYRWSIWVYSAIRLATLLNVLIDIVGSQMIHSIDCQGWFYLELVTVYLSFILGELLMILKIAAVWRRNKWVLAASVCAWLMNIALISFCIFTDMIWINTNLLRLTSQPRPSATDWQSEISLCIDLSGPNTRATTLAILSTETFLLLVMLVALLRERDHRLGRFLFNRGLVWLLVAIIAQVPLLLLLYFDLEELGFMVLHSLSLLSMAICVTRIYRGLSTVNGCQCTKARLDISALGPARVSHMRFASNHSPDSSPDSIETQATESITTTVLEEEQHDANEGTPLEPKFPTMTAPRGNDAV